MIRIEDTFVDKLDGHKEVALAGSKVLEIGCGSGEQSANIAKRVKCVTGIDPDVTRIKLAEARGIKNAKFYRGYLPGLDIATGMFDVVLFTLSLHHIPQQKMSAAITEAAAFLNRKGRMVFLEPGFRGSYFEAEIQFDAGDGDETNAKLAAAKAQMDHPKLFLLDQIPDETAFRVDSVDDFIRTLAPKKNLDAIPAFLEQHGNILRADRWINIFRLRTEA